MQDGDRRQGQARHFGVFFSGRKGVQVLGADETTALFEARDLLVRQLIQLGVARGARPVVQNMHKAHIEPFSLCSRGARPALARVEESGPHSVHVCVEYSARSEAIRRRWLYSSSSSEEDSAAAAALLFLSAGSSSSKPRMNDSIPFLKMTSSLLGMVIFLFLATDATS